MARVFKGSHTLLPAYPALSYLTGQWMFTPGYSFTFRVWLLEELGLETLPQNILIYLFLS